MAAASQSLLVKNVYDENFDDFFNSVHLFFFFAKIVYNTSTRLGEDSAFSDEFRIGFVG